MKIIPSTDWEIHRWTALLDEQGPVAVYALGHAINLFAIEKIFYCFFFKYEYMFRHKNHTKPGMQKRRVKYYNTNARLLSHE